MFYSSGKGNIMDVRNFAMHNGSHVGKETAVSLESGIHYTFFSAQTRKDIDD